MAPTASRCSNMARHAADGDDAPCRAVSTRRMDAPPRANTSWNGSTARRQASTVGWSLRCCTRRDTASRDNARPDRCRASSAASSLCTQRVATPP